MIRHHSGNSSVVLSKSNHGAHGFWLCTMMVYVFGLLCGVCYVEHMSR